jgi:CrcB protein
MRFLLVAMFGALGAVARYLLSGFLQSRSRFDFPVGTLVVNLAGAFAIGLVAGATSLGADTTAEIVGFLGGFTTFSTWMVETIRLGLMQLRIRAIANLALVLVIGVALTAVGYTLAS